MQMVDNASSNSACASAGCPSTRRSCARKIPRKACRERDTVDESLAVGGWESVSDLFHMALRFSTGYTLHRRASVSPLTLGSSVAHESYIRALKSEI